MVEAILFDVGSTLLEASPSIEAVFLEVAQKRGHSLVSTDIMEHKQAVDEFYEAEYLKDGDFWCSPQGSVEIFLDMYRYLSYLVGVEHDSEGIATQVHAEYRSAKRWKIYDDVIPCLKALKESGLWVGVVSNWSPRLDSLLRDLRLTPYFDVIISSAEVGYRKPNPVIFQLALEQIGADPSRSVHVGDRIDADGVGAKAAGVTPVIINRKKNLREVGDTYESALKARGESLAFENSLALHEGYMHIPSLLEIPNLIKTL